MNPNQFIDQLSAIKIAGAFNPYSERCKTFDIKSAPQIRSTTLRTILKRASESELDSIWIGRDLGYRGGRRTGLAFTDDRHLEMHLKRWGIEPQRPTHGDEIAERTATVLWSVLGHTDANVFLWNVFPLHPFHIDQPFSNRAHNRKERMIGIELLVELIDLLEPEKIVPIGRDAAAVATKISGTRQVFPVRHPSYGGQREFLEQVTKLST